MTNHQPSLPFELRSCRGISPHRREALIDQAKSIAGRFTWAVKTRNAAEVQRVSAGLSRDAWAALAVVLAEAVQPGSLRLAQVVRVDDGEETGIA